MEKLLLAGVVALTTLGAVGAAVARPPPPGWIGSHYYWRGRHFHHRAWAWGPGHRGYCRYY